MNAELRPQHVAKTHPVSRCGCGVDTMFSFCSICLTRLNRGRRRSRCSKREPDAVPDNWHRVGAPGGAGPLARAPRPGTLHPPRSALGSRNLGVDRPIARPVGERSQAPRRLPALQPLFLRGQGKQGRRAGPGARIQSQGSQSFAWSVDPETRTPTFQFERIEFKNFCRLRPSRRARQTPAQVRA